MTHRHAIVWLNAGEARIFKFNADDVERKRIKAETHRQVRHRAGNVRDDYVRDNREYFEDILAELHDVDAWLIAGPGETRHDLQKYLEGHAEELKKKLVGVEAMDQPNDRELLAHARAALQG